MSNPRRHVLDSLHAGPLARGPDVQDRDEAVLRPLRAARDRLVREEVAFAENDEAAGDPPDRLYDMRVLADDRVDGAAAKESGRERDLLARRLVDVLGAPVEVRDDEVGARSARAGGVPGDVLRVEQVHR